MLGASQDYEMYYESLRADGSYRAGYTKAESGFPVEREFGEKGRKYIRDNLGVEPLDTKGTKITILNPKTEVIEKIKSGELLRNIEETWWPLINKYGATIKVKDGSKENFAQSPDLFPIDEDEESENLKIWIKKNEEIKIKGKKYRIKKLAVACNLDERVDFEFSGVSVFRGNMKIDDIEFISPKLKNHVYGYVEFDERLDKEMRSIENSNHYEFNHRKGEWRTVKTWVQEELEQFGNEKLGLGVDLREKKAQTRNEAESKALRFIRDFTKEWSFEKKGRGPDNDKNPDPSPNPKDVGVKLSNFHFPNDSARIDYGQSIKDFEPHVFNTGKQDLDLTFKMFILSGDSKIHNFTKKTLKLSLGEELVVGSFDLDVDEGTFPESGMYRIRLKLINNETKEEEDTVTRRFWVEQDPPLVGLPFDPSKVPFEETDISNELEWKLVPQGSGNYELWYNIDHPAYRDNDVSTETLVPYLSQIFSEAAMLVFLKKSYQAGEDNSLGPFEEGELQGELFEFYTAASRVLSSARYKIFE